jgi:hypothetical protein
MLGEKTILQHTDKYINMSVLQFVVVGTITLLKGGAKIISERENK